MWWSLAKIIVTHTPSSQAKIILSKYKSHLKVENYSLPNLSIVIFYFEKSKMSRTQTFICSVILWSVSKLSEKSTMNFWHLKLVLK